MNAGPRQSGLIGTIILVYSTPACTRPLPLESARHVPSLLIPLQNAAFLTIIGNEFMKWKSLLSGSVVGIRAGSPQSKPMYAGNSPREPVWTSWCRPRRVQTSAIANDHLYIVREDGLVFWLQVSQNDSMESCLAEDFQCHAGTAFASLGDESSPDILALAGEMSSGRIGSIGQWPPRKSGRSELERDYVYGTH